MSAFGRLSFLLLLGCCLLAGGIRFYRLGAMDTRSDEVELLTPPIADFGPIQNFVRDFHAFKTGRILGLPRMVASAVVKGFGLETKPRNIRLPYAIMGILTIPALFMLGLRLGDRRLGFILAFLGVINPYLIFYSRYAHVYAFPLLFNAWAAAFAAGIICALRVANRPRHQDIVWFCVASILACHSHMSSWPLIGLLWFLVFLVLWRQRRTQAAREHVRRLVLACGIWLLALAPWIWLFVSALFTAQDSFLQGGVGPHSFEVMWRLPFVMMWGGGWPWVLVTMLLLVIGLAGGLLTGKWRVITSTSAIMGIALFVAMSVMMFKGGNFFNLRYYTPLWLIFNLLGGLGVLFLSDWTIVAIRRLSGKTLSFNAIAGCYCGGVAIFMVYPICWLLHLPGNPSPYSVINRWMDDNLPNGTLVIVDRWLEPWNEMRYHAPTNVVATFTVPTEPYDMMIKFNWPQTVKDFFKSFPDSVYMELVKTSPIIGETWEWPRRHFHRHVALTNEPGLALRHAMLVPEEGYYADNTNRLVVGLFYNTRDDIVKAAREEGQKTLALFGADWQYAKLWQQIHDFRYWRVLEGKDMIEVYNLTDTVNPVVILLRGMAVNGAKRVRCDGLSQADFSNMQLAEWRLENVTLQPGLNKLVLTDEFWSMAHIPLLVDRLNVFDAVK